MIKVILFDCDGPIVKREMYFSQRLGMPFEVLKEFFEGDFLLCETGKKDLKIELTKRLKKWGWKKSVEELMDFWFSNEAVADEKMLKSIAEVRQKGIKCFLATNNEKYRTEYLLNAVGLKKHLDGAFSSAYLGYLKPDLKYWESIYKNFLEIPKEQIVVYDDDEENVKSALEFGFRARFFTTFEDYEKHLRSLIYGNPEV